MVDPQKRGVKMLISVLMCTYREPVNYIEASVNSILQQTYENLEFIIIVDDPDNRDVIFWLQQKQQEDSRIKLYINSQNIGLVNSLNRGLSYCNGEYIARMDADDISDVNRLETQLQFLQKNKLDFIGGAYERFKEQSFDGEFFYYPCNHEDCMKRLKIENCFAHPTWFAKRSVFQACGGYRHIEKCEDYDFVLRTVNEGFKVGNCPVCILKYRFHSDSISRKGFAEQNVIASYLADSFKNGKIVSIQDYEAYLNSRTFLDKRKQELRISELRFKQKNEKNPIAKMVCILKLAVIPLFWKKAWMIYIVGAADKRERKQASV